MAAMIRTEGLAKAFGTTRALDGVDLEVAAGTVLGLLGPDGAGKTTAVRILATLLAPTAGNAQVGGYDVVRPTRSASSPAWPASTRPSTNTSAGPRTSTCSAGCSAWAGSRPAGARGRAAEPLRPGRRCRPAGQDLLGRDASAPGPGGQPGRPATGAVPGRADQRPGPAQPQPLVCAAAACSRLSL
jgi:energy-coupling factor transporter ATP-binding protein EcfA2